MAVVPNYLDFYFNASLRTRVRIADIRIINAMPLCVVYIQGNYTVEKPFLGTRVNVIRTFFKSECADKKHINSKKGVELLILISILAYLFELLLIIA